MRIFDFFKQKNGAEDTLRVSLPVVEPEDSQESVTSVEMADEKGGDNKAEQPLTVSYATGWPIDVVYGYLHKNYEKKGFEDAMLKSDLTFRDMNKNVIKNKILMVFREINLNYDVMRQDLQIRIDTCSAAGLLTTISQLEKQKTLIDSHKEELRRLEENFRNNANESSIPLQSYECGFLRGIATIAMSNTGNNHVNATMNNNPDVAVRKVSIA